MLLWVCSSARGFGVWRDMHVVLWLVLVVMHISLRASLHNNLHTSLALRSHNGWSGQPILATIVD